MLTRRTTTAGLMAAGAHGAARAQDHAITSPNGIDEGRFIIAGGVEQWVRIRGEDRANPVVLYIHGGPGAGMSANGWNAFTRLGWERDFTVVTWDQQGAGRTFARNGREVPADLTIERIGKDGVEIAQAVANRLGKQKIIVVGGSWGSHIGVRMTKLRPALFSAYVGTAQNVNTRQDEGLAYERVLAKARALGDQTAIRELEAAGAPPYPSINQFIVQRKWAVAYERPIAPAMPLAPDARPEELAEFRTAFLATDTYFRGVDMNGPIAGIDLYKMGRDFPMPVFVFHGEDDFITPAARVEAWFNWIRAPRKDLVLIEGGGHNIAFRTGRFLDLMVERVRPLTV